MYLADVEQAENQHLAAVDAKRQQTPVVPSDPGPRKEDLEANTVALAEDQSIEISEENHPPADMFTAKEGRWGSGAIRIEQVTLEGNQGAAHVFHTGERMIIRMQVVAEQEVSDFAFGVSILSTDGVCCYGTNTYIEDLESESFRGVGEVSFAIDRLDLVEGTYKLDVAVHKRDGFSYDYHRLLYTFRVKSRIKDVGFYRPRHNWIFSDAVRFKNAADPGPDVKAVSGKSEEPTPADRG